jgi:glyoxylase-like metal-dependent hydrolase (beta-lactamase superfamily II)
VSEPSEIADHADRATPDIWHWQVRNSGIGGAISSCNALITDGRSVLVDPIRLAQDALDELPPPEAILLTAKCHQRSAWRYRAQFGAEVWAPEGTRPMDAEPDHRYTEGDVLPGGLRAIRTPGPEQVHYCFLLERDPGVLFCSDLLTNYEGEGLDFVPLRFHDDPETTRRSVEGLLDLPFEMLCLDHGAPLAHGAKQAIRDLLDRTT